MRIWKWLLTIVLMVVGVYVANFAIQAFFPKQYAQLHLWLSERDPIAMLFGDCPQETCVVAGIAGGDPGLFLVAAEEIMENNYRLVVDGPCESACAMMADMVRSSACVTPRARFGFHRGIVTVNFPGIRFGTGEGGVRYLEIGLLPTGISFSVHAPPHSPEVTQWVRDRGGFPGGTGMLYMAYDTARTIWPTCPV